MKFSSKRIKLFGLTLWIPVMYLVARKLQAEHAERERTKILRAVRKELGECKRCHTLLEARGGHSFFKHMERDHKLAPEHLHELIADIYRRLYQATCVARAKQ